MSSNTGYYLFIHPISVFKYRMANLPSFSTTLPISKKSYYYVFSLLNDIRLYALNDEYKFILEKAGVMCK
jgi:hypothetical protein